MIKRHGRPWHLTAWAQFQHPIRDGMIAKKLPILGDPPMPPESRSSS
jgi:hypothetical protein